MTRPEKNFDTGLRILELLKMLLDKDLSKTEMMDNVRNSVLFENIYTREAFIKYLNTFEIIGFKIEKEKNIYHLKNAFYTINLTQEEVNVFLELISYIKKLHNRNLEQELNDLIYKMLKYTDENVQKQINAALKQSAQNINNSNNNLIQYLESLLYDNQLISVTYTKSNSSQETIIVELKEIIEKNENIIMVCYDSSKGRNKKIYMTSVVSVKQLPQRVSNSTYLNSVIFRLYGRLAALYKLKDSEKVLDFAAGYITISNSEEDKDALMHRLLKYGENCKIIKPQFFKEDFLALTDDILKNLQEDHVK